MKKLIIAFCLLFPTAAIAGPYGTAGCGLGSILMGDKAGFTQVFAATTNGSFASQIFGIIFGTSNCGASKEASAKNFIETNREALAKDAARGAGETVISLSNLAGCASPEAVGAALQQNYGATFTNTKASNEDISSAVIETLKSNKQLACGNIS
jgi:hypothetical protein